MKEKVGPSTICEVSCFIIGAFFTLCLLLSKEHTFFSSKSEANIPNFTSMNSNQADVKLLNQLSTGVVGFLSLLYIFLIRPFFTPITKSGLAYAFFASIVDMVPVTINLCADNLFKYVQRKIINRLC